MIRAYGLRIALFALAGLLFGAGISFLMPQKYEAVMQVLVDQRPIQNSRMMSNADESVRDLLEAPRPRTVATQVEQLTGFGVLSRAVMAVHEKYGKEYGSIRELQLMNLARNLNVEAATESDIIRLSVRMPDKELARDILTEIYLAFDRQNEENSRESGARALRFLETQTTQIQQELAKVDKQIEDMRRQYNAPDVEQLVQGQVATVRQLDDAYQAAQVDHVALVTRVNALRERLKGVPRFVESGESTGQNSTYLKLESELADARAEKAMLSAQWQEGSQPMKAINERIKNLEAALRQVPQQIRAGSQRSTNPLYQMLTNDLAQAEAQAASAQNRVAALGAALAAKRQSLTQLPELQRKATDLMRQQSSLTQTYLQYKDSVESLRVSERGRYTPSTLISPPWVNPDPVSPNIPLNLMAGVMAGILMGVLSAFASESKRSPIRNLTQLNRLAFEPSFRTIPELPLAVPSLTRTPDDAFVALLGGFARSEKRPYKLGVIGIDPGAGATTTAGNLAVAAIADGHSTLLIEASPGLGQRLGLPDEPLQDVGEQLTVLKAHGDSLAQLNGRAQDIDALAQGKDLVVFDLQPYRTGTNPLLFLADLDECLLLARAGQTRSIDFVQAQQMLLDAGVKQVTVVLSRTRGLDDDFSFVEPEPPALTAR